MRPSFPPNAYVNPYATLFRDSAQAAEAADVLNRMMRNGGRGRRVMLQSSTPVAEGSEPDRRVTRMESGKRVVKLPVDAWQSNEAYIITAYVPGVDINEVEISFEDDELSIRGRFPRRADKLQDAEAESSEAPEGEQTDDNDKIEVVRSELFHGHFERRLTFRQPINADAIEATYSLGVLTLNVPKAEVVKPRQIRVTAK